ncbi:MAG: deoxyribodipyrimidine photo-lyase [Roseiflexaceae bacterium]|nr:deoxyribodipyrimidine photo-lyase [Roseiflexaceae bacterium]
MPPIIHWFRRDLRLHDNLALAAALRESGGQVLPLFIFDDTILHSPRVGPVRVQFLLESLAALDSALQQHGSRLLVRQGDPAAVLVQLAEASGAGAIFFNRDYTPFARQRDQRVQAALQQARREVRSFQDLVIWEPDQVLTQADKPYTVYTPYRRQWRSRIEADPRPIVTAPELAMFAPLPAGIDPGRLPSAQQLGHRPSQYARAGGEAEGLQRLASFADLANPDGIRDYHVQRDFMARPATSRLSAYLHLGCVSTRACVRVALAALERADAAARPGIDAWLGEITWHDFYMQILYHFPHVLRGAFKPEFNALEWQNDTSHFAAWCQGRTGYPVVDAAMRQLNSEGWMHNRARMIVASFLIKDLLIDWRWGERYFLQQLVDGDHAANNGGWQWVAGTGTDAQPYFRIFNPTSQGQKFDPDGAYVRQYLPELQDVPKKFIHTPWQMTTDDQQKASVKLDSSYPAPIVDHKVQRERALAMYAKARREAAAAKAQ